MPKSNGRVMTSDRHNALLGGRLQEVVEAIERLPGIAERNELRLQALARKRRAAIEVLLAPQTASPTPETARIQARA